MITADETAAVIMIAFRLDSINLVNLVVVVVVVAAIVRSININVSFNVSFKCLLIVNC